MANLIKIWVKSSPVKRAGFAIYYLHYLKKRNYLWPLKCIVKIQYYDPALYFFALYSCICAQHFFSMPTGNSKLYKY